MASTSTKIVMKFIDEDEKNFNVTMNYAKEDVTDAAVKNLMDTMITKSRIFQRPPYQKTGAEKVTTTTVDLAVAD